MFPRAVKSVVRVEQLFLERLFVLHELHVVDEENVTFSIVALEGNGGSTSHRVNEVVQKCFGGDVEDPVCWVVLQHVVSDGVEQVSFSET